MPVPTLDDDCSTAYDALERLVTASVQVITYLDNLTDDLPEGADAVRAFRDSHAAWFGQELTRFLAFCAELGYDTATSDDVTMPRACGEARTREGAVLTMEYAVWKAVRLTIVAIVAAVVTAALAPDWRLTIIVAVIVFVVGLALPFSKRLPLARLERSRSGERSIEVADAAAKATPITPSSSALAGRNQSARACPRPRTPRAAWMPVVGLKARCSGYGDAAGSGCSRKVVNSATNWCGCLRMSPWPYPGKAAS